MLNDASVASAGSYIRTCRRIRNSKKIATIRDFHQNMCVNSTIWGNVLLGGKLQIGAKNSNFEIFWERPLYEISEYAFNIDTLLLMQIYFDLKLFHNRQLVYAKRSKFIMWHFRGRSDMRRESRNGRKCSLRGNMMPSVEIMKIQWNMQW